MLKTARLYSAICNPWYEAIHRGLYCGVFLWRYGNRDSVPIYDTANMPYFAEEFYKKFKLFLWDYSRTMYMKFGIIYEVSCGGKTEDQI